MQGNEASAIKIQTWYHKVPRIHILEKHMVPEEKRKRNGRVNGGCVQNADPGRKTEEKRKGKWKKVISAQMEKTVVFLWMSFPYTEHALHTGRLFLPEWIIGWQQEP